MQLSPSGRQRMMSRQQQNGIAPLDLAMPDNSLIPDHLSPVYETRSPSPTAVRRFEGVLNRGSASLSDRPYASISSSSASPKESRKDAVATQPHGPKSPTEWSHTRQDGPPWSPLNRRVNGVSTGESGHVRGAKSESDNAGGWQKAKSRKKTGDGKTPALPHGEQMPKNEADRRGG